MPVDSHEEEQVEAIKKWWQENGRFVVIGAGLGFALLFSWRYWQDYQHQQAEIASLNFEQALIADSNNNIEQAKQFSQTILNSNPDSPYAIFSSFLSAEEAVKNKQLDVAEGHLQWVIKNGKISALVQIAHLRLARIELSKTDYSAAEQQLAAISDDSFAALKADIQGDIFWAQDRTADAKSAYANALGQTTAALSGKHRAWVQTKHDQLGIADLKLVQAPAFAQASTVVE